MRKAQPRKERGQALILIVLAIVGLIGMTALAVDGGNAYSERRRAQNAADASALDAALAKVRGGNLYNEGLDRASSNSFVDGDATAATTNTLVNVEIYNPPTSGAYNCTNRPADCNDYIQVIITATVPTYFGRIVGISQITNKVQAVARVKPGTPPSSWTGNAIIGLDDGCQAVTVQGNGSGTVTGGGLFANGANCGHNNALFNASNAANLTADCYSAVGGIQNNGGLNNPPGTSCYNPDASPLPPLVMPNPTCSSDVSISGSTMTAGNWPPAGHHGPVQFPPSGVDTLQSGIYCINDGAMVVNNSPLSGNGVVIVMNSGQNVTINGSGDPVNLQAPTTGPYAGLLFYVPESSSSTDITINGNANVTMTGTMLAPYSTVNISGTSGSAFNLSSQIIGWNTNITGTAGLNLQYNSGDQFQLQVYPRVELMQ